MKPRASASFVFVWRTIGATTTAALSVVLIAPVTVQEQNAQKCCPNPLTPERSFGSVSSSLRISFGFAVDVFFASVPSLGRMAYLLPLFAQPADQVPPLLSHAHEFSALGNDCHFSITVKRGELRACSPLCLQRARRQLHSFLETRLNKWFPLAARL